MVENFETGGNRDSWDVVVACGAGSAMCVAMSGNALRMRSGVNCTGIERRPGPGKKGGHAQRRIALARLTGLGRSHRESYIITGGSATGAVDQGARNGRSQQGEDTATRVLS